jgi:paraquat-inducible protein B
LTGLLYIELGAHPGTPVNLMLEPGSGLYPEIPTIPTYFQQMQETAVRALADLDRVDFVALIRSITSAATATSNLMNSPDIRSTLAALQLSAKNMNTSIASFRELTQNLIKNGAPVVGSWRRTSDQANRALVQMTSAAQELQASFSPDGPLAYRLDVALENFSEASNAIRDLGHYLQRNPSAIVRGRYVADIHQ